MNKEKEQHEIEELLSLYIDRQLSERTRTEVKRLIQHDEAIAEKLRIMQKTKRLLNELPTKAAPETMTADIQAVLERRFILGSSQRDEESAGAKHLFVQRTMAAAVLIGFCGIFGWVIFNIITPASAPQTDVAVVSPPIEPAIEPETKTVPEPPAIATAPATATVASTSDYYPMDKIEPFDGTLLLSTNQPIEVNNFLKKAIYSNGLIDHTIPKQHGANRSYHITCSADTAIDLLTDIQLLWGKCKTAKLTVFGKYMHSGIRIDNISNAQMAALIEPTTSAKRTGMAKNYARANELMTSPTQTFASGDDLLGTSIFEVPVKPVLTAEPAAEAPVAAENTNQNEIAKITITVVSL